MRLVDACEVHAEIQRMICSNRYNKSVDALTDVLKVLTDATTIDAEPVRYGRWIFGESNGHSWMKCDCCLKSQDFQTGVFSYCPNCGANMILYKQLAEAADRMYMETSIVRPSLTREQFMELLNSPLIPIPDDTE